MKTESQWKKLLDELEKTGMIGQSCRKAGITKITYYRKRAKSPKFKRDSDLAIALGAEKIYELVESNLLESALKDRDPGSMRFFLTHKHPDYIHPEATLKKELKRKEEEGKKKISGFRLILQHKYPKGDPRNKDKSDDRPKTWEEEHEEADDES